MSELGKDGAMASHEELLDALDQRILEALAAKSTGESVVRLFEARAWLTNPDQPHGGAAVHS